MTYFIKRLAENERLVMELYQLFAKKLPKYRQFWESIAEEERKHCTFLEKIYRLLNENKVEINERIISPKSITDSIDHITTLISVVKKSETEFSMKKAVSEAINIENSMIEHKFFNSFVSKDEQVTKSLQTLEIETKSHYNKLKEMKTDLI